MDRTRRTARVARTVATALAVLTVGVVVAPHPATAAANPNPARITDASWWLMEELLKLQPGSQNGGIYANKPGYHNTRAGNSSTNYSVRDAEDQGGPADKAAAYDWTFPEAQSIALSSLAVDPDADQQLPAYVTSAASNFSNIARFSNRLLASAKDPDDPRLNGWREFFGQADNDYDVEGWDFRYNRAASSDSSHLWHIHLSEDRDKVESLDNKRALLSVLRGETVDQWRTDLVGTGPTAIQWESNLNVYNVSRRTGKVYQRSFVTGSGWTSSWLDLGGEMSGRVAAISYRGALNLYAVNRNNGSIYQKAYNDGAWTAWENLGGEFRGSPTVVQFGTALNLYGFSKDKGYLYQKSYVPGSGWGAWERIGDGQFVGSPAAVTMGGNTVHVAGLSATGRLYLNTYSGGWQGWYQPSGTGQFQAGSTPALVPRGSSLHLYAVGIGNAHAWENKQIAGATWSGWTALDIGQFEGSLNAAATTDGGLTLFAISPGNRVYHKRYESTWAGWGDLGGEMTGRPEAIELNGTLYLFTTSLAEGSTWVRTRTTAGWQSWLSLA